MPYEIKLIFCYTVRNEATVLEQKYEESIVSVKAETPDEVFKKAEKYAEEYCEEYENPDGDLVKIEVFSISDCFEIYDEEDGVTEIYSKFYTHEGKPCGPDELWPLRYREFNAPRA